MIVGMKRPIIEEKNVIRITLTIETKLNRCPGTVYKQ